MTMPLIVLAGGCLALLLLALVLLGGAALVRLLRLPQDPPESVLFCLPPPEPAADPDAARAQASLRREQRTELLRAQTIAQRTLRAMERIPAEGPAPEQAALHEHAQQDLDALERILRTADPEQLRHWLEQRGSELERHCTQAEQLPPPRPDLRRLLLMLGLLVLSLVWLGAIMLINRGVW